MRGGLVAMLGWGLLSAGAAQAQQVVANVGFVSSECVRYDAARDRYVVSNLGEQRGGVSDGFISLLSPEGQVTELKWIAGGADGLDLRDPLGLAVVGDTLHVLDSAAVRSFDLVSGKLKRTVAVPGAARLNDVAVAPSGDLYVTDSGTEQAPGAIYRISAAGAVSPFVAPDAALERPNGITMLKDGTIVHGGRGVNLVFRSAQGRILREQTLPQGNFDGIIALDDGSLLVSSQGGRVVYRVPAGGKGPVTPVAQIEAPAAIGLDTKRNRLLVPQIKAGSVTFVELPR